MRRNRLNRRKSNRKNKFIIIISIFIVCILFVAVGIKFTQRAKADSEGKNKLKIQSLTSDENKKQQNNNSNDQEKNKPNDAAKTNDNSTDKPSPVDNKSNNETTNNENSVKPDEQLSSSNNEKNGTPVPPAPNNSGNATNEEPSGNKVAYLTFDDGPSRNVTPEVLDVLKKENVQATFFVVGQMCKSNPDLLIREKAEGHSIGNHSYSHDYKIIYSSPDNFLRDFKQSEDIITSIIGPHDTSLIRFPGGSFNRNSFKQVAANSGYRYVDWNCLTGDAEVSLASVDRLLLRFNETMGNQDNLIILMHDAQAKYTTPKALPQIIQILKSKGYTFKGL